MDGWLSARLRMGYSLPMGKMRLVLFVWSALAGLLLILIGTADHSLIAQEPPIRDVSELLAPIIKKHDVPGMSVAVVSHGKTVALGVAGVRSRGKDEPVTNNDQFHIGSDTKAMTAMLCGILVEEEKLNWEQTLGETFPEFRKTMHPQYQAITLEQLLTNRGGAPSDIEDQLWSKLYDFKGTSKSARRFLVETLTKSPPEADPGEKFIYSNAGFTLAGAMAEKVTGKTWENLMREKIFRPLEMTSAGFGPPGRRGKNDQPRGHQEDGSAVEPGPKADNPLAIGPAGIVHCSVADWARFAAANLPDSETKLVQPETLKKLHTPAAEDPPYAMGWVIDNNQPWAGGPALTHAGSNTLWYAVAWLAPEKDFAVLVACNQAHSEACNDAVLALIADLLRQREDR